MDDNYIPKSKMTKFDPEKPRTSTFFVTINTNKRVSSKSELIEYRLAFDKMMYEIFKISNATETFPSFHYEVAKEVRLNNLLTLFQLNDNSDLRKFKIFDINYEVEVGKQYKRAHLHLRLKVKYKGEHPQLDVSGIKMLTEKYIPGVTNPYVNIQGWGDRVANVDKYMEKDKNWMSTRFK
jgi:hypothetical protein